MRAVLQRLIRALTPASSERDADYDAENEQTRALARLMEVEQDINRLESELARARCRQATLQAEYRAWSIRAARERGEGE